MGESCRCECKGINILFPSSLTEDFFSSANEVLKDSLHGNLYTEGQKVFSLHYKLVSDGGTGEKAGDTRSVEFYDFPLILQSLRSGISYAFIQNLEEEQRKKLELRELNNFKKKLMELLDTIRTDIPPDFVRCRALKS